MSNHDESKLNPYAAPETSPELFSEPVRSTIDPVLVRNFRQQIHALGGLWIASGLLALAIGVGGFGATAGLWGEPGVDVSKDQFKILFATATVVGAIFLFLGVAACMKNMWAVHIGLILAYLSLITEVISINVCSIVITILIIVQAHRVIGWSKLMNAAGVPLTTKPERIMRA